MTDTRNEEAGGLSWLMQNFVEDTPSVLAAQLSSADGLQLARWGLDKEQADYLSPIVAAHLPLFNGSLQKVTRSAETVHEDTVVNAGNVIVFVVSAGQGGILCALTEKSADIGVVGFELGELVNRVGRHLGVDPRSRDSHAHEPLG